LKQHYLHSQQGFNLVELLVAIAIIGIGLAVAVPGFSNLTMTNRISTQASEFQTALNFARNEAIRLNDNVLFCHSTNQLTCSAPPSTGWVGWLVSRAGPAIGAEPPPPLRFGTIDGQLLKVTSNPALAVANHAVRFNPQGLGRLFQNNTPLSGQIEVCTTQITGSENLYSVRFNSGGRSEVVRLNTAGVCQ
jgi:type IV fimbrial biogenesis protein FimT